MQYAEMAKPTEDTEMRGSDRLCNYGVWCGEGGKAVKFKLFLMLCSLCTLYPGDGVAVAAIDENRWQNASTGSSRSTD